MFLLSAGAFAKLELSPLAQMAKAAGEVIVDLDGDRDFWDKNLYYKEDLYYGIRGCIHHSSSSYVAKAAKKKRLKEIKDFNKKKIGISILSEKDVQKYFKKMKSQKHIPFGYPEDGCYARAQEMSMILEKNGVITGKVFIEGDLRVKTDNSPKGYVEWWYHVAPIVFVKKGNKIGPYVLDPSLFKKAVPLDEWVKIQTKHKPKQKKDVYFTKRFNYTPGEKTLDLKDYDAYNIESGKSMMKDYLAIQKARKAARERRRKRLKSLNDLIKKLSPDMRKKMIRSVEENL